MRRRVFLRSVAAGSAALTAATLAACGQAPQTPVQQATTAPAQQATTAPVQQATQAPVATAPQPQAPAQTSEMPSLEWDMATSWPVALDTIFGGAKTVADRVAALTDGKFKITPRAAGELAPALQVLDVVQQDAVPIGHTASYYYVGKSPVTAFGTTVPFGLNAQQQNAWLYDGGGLEKLQAVYAKLFNVIQFPAGNTGVQMGGWFRKEINTVADLQGLKMRIPGLGGQVLTKLGVTVQVIPGGEIFQALQTGAVDAAEWVGPYDDEKLGLNKAAKFYYYPGWWEPGPTLEVQVNLDRWNELPKVYQEAIKTASAEANITMLARYDARNREALKRLVDGGAQLRPYSKEILAAAEKAAFELYDEFAAKDADFKEIYEEWKAFREAIYEWNKVNEAGYTNYAYNK
ncbi:TRAP transporter substrate-binding protein [Roseiflexus sp. RS-1]|jgi:TRAP-type mannitol/chloroaromatic compound transport system substrate-binding protein|uniref:TRAP transporter substrate-binding protein n=1 Tax=Roseiflexus sp. (strain RS-1) TaxID=357808 RepID=UPI0000D8193C|nr:TRAP transporter substrate-binding protein [Roseiflexus sp. RS-1]ABQ92355.1 TRAP dicarboxylate transporter- DctP subunit [Roseiflexus sp. RS-1]MBO9323237.1 TRAP transporter substrate-binding protein DctP [Roseiflexus sp.]